MTLRKDELPTAISSRSAVSNRKPVLFVLGTRPEGIKLCPLIAALQTTGSRLEAIVCVTGQHREMLHQVLAAFQVKPDFDLDVMTGGQTLNLLSSGLLAGLEAVFEAISPALTIVQGDTTSTLCGALASFHRRVPVAHVEAGLRTYDLHSPFPEESNRVLVDRLSDFHFAATPQAAANLLREGYSAASVVVTGNTGIDALLQTVDSLKSGHLQPRQFLLDASRRLILVTAHRRENFGPPLAAICDAVASLASRDDVQVVWPVHPNPQVKEIVEQWLRPFPNVLLCEPLNYVSFVDLMRRSYLILTDSGGIQEEAPSLGKPVLVLRDKTERPEGVEFGSVRLAGTGRDSILLAASTLLDDPAAYRRMAHRTDRYGDGKASVRIAHHLAAYFFPDKQAAAIPPFSGPPANQLT